MDCRYKISHIRLLEVQWVAIHLISSLLNQNPLLNHENQSSDTSSHSARHATDFLIATSFFDRGFVGIACEHRSRDSRTITTEHSGDCFRGQRAGTWVLWKPACQNTVPERTRVGGRSFSQCLCASGRMQPIAGCLPDGAVPTPERPNWIGDMELSHVQRDSAQFGAEPTRCRVPDGNHRQNSREPENSLSIRFQANHDIKFRTQRP